MDELKSELVAIIDETLVPAIDTPLTSDIIDELKTSLIALIDKYYSDSELTKDSFPKKENESEAEKQSRKTSGHFAALTTENTALKRQVETMSSLLIENEYSALFREGKINAERKSHFTAIAKTQGVKFAREVFSMAVTQPPKGEVIENLIKPEIDERLRKVYADNLGMNPKSIAAAFAERSKRNGGV